MSGWGSERPGAMREEPPETGVRAACSGWSLIGPFLGLALAPWRRPGCRAVTGPDPSRHSGYRVDRTGRVRVLVISTLRTEIRSNPQYFSRGQAQSQGAAHPGVAKESG